jgi:hypothetical protein
VYIQVQKWKREGGLMFNDWNISIPEGRSGLLVLVNLTIASLIKLESFKEKWKPLKQRENRTITSKKLTIGSMDLSPTKDARLVPRASKKISPQNRGKITIALEFYTRQHDHSRMKQNKDIFKKVRQRF